MYDELVKRLRELASIPEHCENVADCDECSKEEICLSYTNKRIIEVATQAADAVEGLEEKAQVYAETLYAYEHPWIPVTWYLGNGHLRETWRGDMIESDVTHWMPLPEPPKED